MRVLAFDLSSKTGYCAWDGISDKPTVIERHTVALWGIDDGAMIERFRLWLGRQFEEHRPEAVSREAPAMGPHQDAPTIYRQAALHTMVAWAAHLYKIPLYTIPNSTWRKSFIGFGARGKRIDVDWKRLAMDRCRALGWEPRDHNAAEAGGLLDHTLLVELGITTPWRRIENNFLPLPEIQHATTPD